MCAPPLAAPERIEGTLGDGPDHIELWTTPARPFVCIGNLLATLGDFIVVPRSILRVAMQALRGDG